MSRLPQLAPKTEIAQALYARAHDLIESGADINGSFNGQSPLLAQAALSDQHVATALLLLSRGANPDVIDGLGKTPLLYAAEVCAHKIVALLLYFGANPNHPCYQKRPNKTTPLHALCLPIHDSSRPREINARQHAVEWLLAAGANTNAQDAQGITPFFGLVACLKNRSTFVLLQSAEKKLFYTTRKNLINSFLACKANPEIKDISGKNLHTQTHYSVDPYLDMYVGFGVKKRREKLREVLLKFLKTSKLKPDAESPFKQLPPDIIRHILKIAYP